MDKVIYVNLWDDYRQQPEYAFNETTSLKIEHEMDSESFIELREQILDLCLLWKNEALDYASDPIALLTDDLSDVHFSRNIIHNKLDIIGLDTPKRHSLFKFLSNCKLDFNDIPVQFTMES